MLSVQPDWPRSESFLTESHRVPYDANASNIVENFFHEKPSPAASRSFRVCIPDEWYRRSRSRRNSAASLTPSDDTVKRLESLEESDEEDSGEGEGDGTAKQKGRIQETVSSSPGFFTANSEWRSSMSQSRLSSIFDSWRQSTGSTNATISPPSSPEKKIVSEPTLIPQNTGGPFNAKTSSNVSSKEAIDVVEFEHMLVSMHYAIPFPSLSCV